MCFLIKTKLVLKETRKKQENIDLSLFLIKKSLKHKILFLLA